MFEGPAVPRPLRSLLSVLLTSVSSLWTKYHGSSLLCHPKEKFMFAPLCKGSEHGKKCIVVNAIVKSVLGAEVPILE